MKTLLASLLIAQGFNVQQVAENPAIGYKLGVLMGTYMCHYMPYGRTLETTSYLAAEGYMKYSDHQFPGLFMYIGKLPNSHSTKKAFNNGMGDQIYNQCPQFFSIPDK